jgi:N utilization substance protein B
MFILYQQDLLNLPLAAVLQRMEDEQLAPYAEELVRGVDQHRDEIDSLLGDHLQDWELDRLGVLERAILRLATFELLYEPQTPKAVVIDQAVEQAKRYCCEEAGALVNGVLGALVESRGASSRSASLRPEADEE